MRRNKIQAYIHLVWATWDRLPLIKPDVERELYRYISAVCRDDNCEVIALGGMEDHVHLLVSLAPTISLADLMKHVKGGSSRFMSEELVPGEWFQWQGHYGAFSVSRKHLQRVTDYIRNQKQHHADSSIWPNAEEPTDEITPPRLRNQRVRVGGHSAASHTAEEFIPLDLTHQAE